MVWMSRPTSVQLPPDSRRDNTAYKMAPNNQRDRSRRVSNNLTPSSPRTQTQEPARLVDDDLQRDMDQNPNPFPQPEVQPVAQPGVQPDVQPDVQILEVIDANNEDREVRNWKMFAGYVRWYTSTK